MTIKTISLRIITWTGLQTSISPDVIKSARFTPHTENTQKGNKMNSFAFATWMVYALITAVWLGDNGWTPIVGIPWLLINVGYFAYILRTDYQNRR